MIYYLMRVVSAVFHPLLMTTYSCILIYAVLPDLFSPFPATAIPYFILSIFVLTFLIPVVSILFLKMTRKLSTLEMTKREERVLPFFFISAFYIITTYLLNTRMILPRNVLILMILVSVLVTTIFLISTKFKISVHSAGAWGMAGIFSGLALKYMDGPMQIPLMLMYLVAGLTTTSRLYLGRHTPVESWSGAVLGFTICFFGVLFFG